MQWPLSSLREDSKATKITFLILKCWFDSPDYGISLLAPGTHDKQEAYFSDTHAVLSKRYCYFLTFSREKDDGVIFATHCHLLGFLGHHISYFSHQVCSSEKQCNDLHNELNFLL